MKRIFLPLFLLLMYSSATKAQNFSEWFEQKNTQKKYLLQQIAANQVYLDYLNKGYKIAKNGLGSIGSLAQKEFTLHGDYFNTLKNVNPEIKNYAKVIEIVDLQVGIVQNYNKTIKQIKRSDSFSSAELSYVHRVFKRLLDACETTLDELITTITNGKLEMKDDERMSRIDKLHLDMQDKFTFSQSFSKEAKLMAVSRLQENKEIKISRALHNLKIKN